MTPQPTFLGYTPDGEPFCLTPAQRYLGTHVIGMPGLGKSTLAELITRQDIWYGAGGGMFLDPHGASFRALVYFCARHRLRRRIYLVNPSDGTHVIGINPFAPRPGCDVSTRVLRSVLALLKAWGIDRPDETPRMYAGLKNTFTLAMERGDLGLSDLMLLFDPTPAGDGLRTYLSAGTSVETEWQRLNGKKRAEFDELTESTRLKLDGIISSRTARRFLSSIDPTTTLDFGRAIEEGAWISVNVQPSPQLDPQNSRVFGTLCLNELYDAITQRHVRPGRRLKPFSVTVDEAHLFLTPELPRLFAEGRKFGLQLTCCHQFLDQMRHEDERILAGLNGACGTKIVFRLGSAGDAAALVPELYPGQLNFTEPKYVQPQTKFRPVATRERSLTMSQGGGATHTDGGGQGTSTGQTVARGTSHTATVGRNHTNTESQGTTHTQGVTRGVTRTRGEGITWTKAKGIARGQGRSHSYTTGHVHTETDNHGTSATYGTVSTHSDGVTTPGDATLLATSTSTESQGTTESWSETHNHGVSDTTSETDSDSQSQSVTRSRVKSRAYGRNRSYAKSVTKQESDGTTQTTAESRGRSESTADTTSQTQSETAGRSQTKTWSEAESESWAKAVTDGPGTRHVEFHEDAPVFFTLEEQRQRKADELRMLPKATCVVRGPDMIPHTVRVGLVEPVCLPARLVAAYEARCAENVNAPTADKVDQIIDDRRRQIEHRARETPLKTTLGAAFDAGANEPVHFMTDAPRQPTRNKSPKPTQRLNPALRKTQPSEG